MHTKKIFLSHFIDLNTPTYGNRNHVLLSKKNSIDYGDAANETHITTTLHVGTHIDFPFHFYAEGQTIKAFQPDFWSFTSPLLIEVQPTSLVIENELIDLLEKSNPLPGTDILLIKTGYGAFRGTRKYWEENPGFAPSVYDYLRKKLPKARVIGFDSISVSSFQHRTLGRAAHKKFLNPMDPVLLVEDMDLSSVHSETIFMEIIIAPLLVDESDGVPCTVLASIIDG